MKEAGAFVFVFRIGDMEIVFLGWVFVDVVSMNVEEGVGV